MSSRLAFAVALLLSSCADPPLPVAPVAKPNTVSPAAPEPVPTSDAVPVFADDPSLGPKTARTTVVVWSDFQCPYCARVEPTLASLRKTFGDDLRIVWKDNPLKFHKWAHEAAVVGRVIFDLRGNDAFFRFHDTVFEHQAQLSPEMLTQWAAEAQVGPAEIEKGRAAADAKIDQSLDLGAKVGFSGTPALVVDGDRIVGAKPYSVLHAVVEQHIGEAKQLEANGVPKEQIYDRLVRAHFAAPVPEQEEESPVDATVWNVAIGDAPTRGPADALVTVVEFADFQCPFCKRNAKTLAALDAKYPGKLRFVFKHAPLSFHDRAVPAANLAIEARKQGGDALFFKAHDALYAASSLADEDLSRIATELGIDPKKALDAVASGAGKAVLERDQAQGDDLEVKGTPCTFVNGRRIEGAESFAVFTQVVDEELKKAEAKVAGGMPAAKVYAETIAGGKGAPVELSIPKNAAWKGGAKAAVVVQVFSDFQCPFCKRLEVHEATDTDGRTGALAGVAKKYGDKIKIVWRDYPLEFHSRARAAAAFAREAMAQKGLAGFWKAHDALFASQADLSEQSFETIAKQIGLNWKKTKTALDEGTWTSAIEDDVKEANRAFVSGTPTIFVDGHRIVGAQPQAVLERAIERALVSYAKAKGSGP